MACCTAAIRPVSGSRTCRELRLIAIAAMGSATAESTARTYEENLKKIKTEPQVKKRAILDLPRRIYVDC